MADVRASRWPRAILVVSLSLNLLVAGLAVGMLFSHDRRGDQRADRPEQVLRDIGNVPFVMALSPEDRKAMIARLGGDGHGPAIRANRERLRVRFEAVVDLLRAETFDAEALRTLFAEQRAALYELQQLGEASLIERLSTMTLDERQAYADRLDKSLRRGPRRTPRP